MSINSQFSQLNSDIDKLRVFSFIIIVFLENFHKMIMFNPLFSFYFLYFIALLRSELFFSFIRQNLLLSQWSKLSLSKKYFRTISSTLRSAINVQPFKEKDSLFVRFSHAVINCLEKVLYFIFLVFLTL